MKNTRFSPALLAFLAVSSVLGIAAPARSQTPDSSSIAAPIESSNGASASVVDAAAPAIANAKDQRAEIALNGVVGQSISPPERLDKPASVAQADPVEPSDEGIDLPSGPPPASTTPTQDTPNVLQEDIGNPRIDNEVDIDLNAPAPTPTPGTTPAPGATPLPSPTTPPPATGDNPSEARVLVAEVVVSGATGDLETVVYNAVTTEPGLTTTRSQLQRDINAVFATGYFANVRAVPSDTPLGVRVTFVVEPNPVLRSVQVQGSEVLPPEVIDEIFSPQYGTILNLNEFQQSVEALNKWYQDNGYVLAQVVDAPSVSPDGTVTLQVAEGVIEDIQVRFLTEEGEPTDDEGNPVDGRTRDFIITREFESKPGEVFNQQTIQADLQRAYGLGIFEDLRVSLNPGDDPRKVDVTVNVIERSTGSLAAGVGISSASGLFGTVSYQEQNLGGNNQRLAAELQLGERDLLFDLSFTDPWIAGDPYHTSYTVNSFSRRSIPLVFTGGPDEVYLPNGDRPRTRRLGGGISFGRPLDNGWRTSLGLQYQNVRIQDADGDLSPVDEFGNQLSFSGTGVDDLFVLQFAASQDQRDSSITPTSGYALRLSTDQSIPLGEGNIFFNRLRGNFSYFIPVNFTDFTEGPETLAFNVQGGIIIGDLPPYEAFSIGGTDSVRGYDSGDVGSGRAFVLGSVEYRFPIFSVIGGALFFDVGSDLGTGTEVPGEPAVIRDKPGAGFGFGAGIRVQSPLGPIRVDYAINDQGDTRIHFGIGERF